MGNTTTFANPQPPKGSAPTGKRLSGNAIRGGVDGAALQLIGVGIGTRSGNTTTVTKTAPVTDDPIQPRTLGAARRKP